MSRISVEESTRHVRVEVDGVTVAESTRPRILHEKSLPPRYYLPLADVRTDLLIASDTETRCPYKGTASYWSLQVGERTLRDAVWGYRDPLPEREDIAGLVCFYDDKVDLYLDGQPQ